MPETVTISQVYDDINAQLENGKLAVLSALNMPSVRLWELVAQTLSSDPNTPTTQIIVSPPSPQTPVHLSPILVNDFEITGEINLIGIKVSTTITVSVISGEPNIIFNLTVPNSWVLGSSFWQFNNRLLNVWCSQLDSKILNWQSEGKDNKTALLLNASLIYTGVYSIINSIYSGQTTQAFSTPIAFTEHGPTIDVRIDVIHTSEGAISIGPVDVKVPYFVSRLNYVPSDVDQTIMVPDTNVAIAWHLDSQNTSVNNFEITAQISDDNPTLNISGSYPGHDDALALNDIINAIYGGGVQLPTLPGPLDFLATDVGLQYFSVALDTNPTIKFEYAEVYIGTKPGSKGWVIIGPDSDPLLALTEIHFSYSTSVISDEMLNIVTLGGTIKISKLLFSAEVSYTTIGSNYLIDGAGELTTVDGLPLRFSDLISGLGAPSVAAAFDDFLELSFSAIGAEISYESTNGVTHTSWSAYANADLDLKFFGQELLGFHNTNVAVMGEQSGQGPTVFSVSASGDVIFLGLTLPAQLVLSETTKTFTIGPVSFTLGGMITWMVNIIHPSWNYELPEPWDVLNSIGFENLTIEFDLEKKSVAIVTDLKADFGFINISSLRLTYHKSTPGSAEQGVIFAMKGTFLGLPIEVTTDDPDLESDEMGWDLVNVKPIEVPGAGDELFKLEYLGIGQHVAFRDTSDLKSIGDVISALENNLKPSVDSDGNPLAKMDGLIFAENSGWLLGTKFSVLSTVTISAIFNDPQLYGLRIELDGEKAQSLSGLQFEILYKRITDTIGLYHIDLRLPDAIRQLEFGEVSVTIPEFVLDIYTNGNFKIDVGFPYKLDFSRSFSVEVFPFVGFGGIYFGILEGATSDRVPTVSDGTFKPVIEFGLGLSIGVGKTIEKGMLRAGATLTVEGLVEGVVAWFNPDDTDRDSELFYAIAGTVGIEGHIYGAIDFKIIKASIDLTASARVTLAIECYQPIDIELNVNVSARVSVKILFVTIHCSFDLDLHLEYTIGHATTPPWTISHDNGQQLARTQKSLSHLRHDPVGGAHAKMRSNRSKRRLRAMMAPMINLSAEMLDTSFLSVANTSTTIKLQFRPFFTQSDHSSLANPQPPASGERARSIPMFFTSDGTNAASDTQFAVLAEMMFERVAAALLAQKSSEKDRISLFDLSVIKHQLDQGLQDPDFTYDKLVQYFIAAGLVFEIDSSDQSSSVAGTFFPMIPALTLTDTLSDGTNPDQQFVNVNYLTDPRFMVDQTYETIVNDYFRKFQTRSDTAVEHMAGEPLDGLSPPAAGPAESMAQFVFRDYFLMITRSMVDAAITYLESYTYTVPVAGAQSLNDIATSTSAPNDIHDENPTALTIASANLTSTDILDPNGVNNAQIIGAFYQANNGETLDEIAARFGITASELSATQNSNLGSINAAGPNMFNTNIQIDVGDITYTTPVKQANDLPVSSASLASIALLFSVPNADIQNDPANSNLDFTKPFLPGTQVKVPGAKYVMQPTDTLNGLATRFGTSLASIVSLNSTMDSLVKPLSVWAIPTFTHTWQTGDTLQLIAQKYALSIVQLLQDGYSSQAIIKAGAELTVPYRPDILASDMYAAMQSTTVTDPIAKSVSRFMMYGLRLPQISPLTFNVMKAFYNNIGQQINVPSEILRGAAGYNYSIDLSASPLPAWITFASGANDITSYTYSTDDITELGVFNATYTPAAITMRQMPLMVYAPNRYPLRHVTHWQSPNGLEPVTGQNADGNSEPNIWTFPSSLVQRLQTGPLIQTIGTSPQVDETVLKFDIAVGHHEKPNVPATYTQVDNFAWGTLINIEIKRVMAGSSSSEAVANDYLISGTDPENRQALYHLWTHMADPAYHDTADIYILSNADPASQSSQGVMCQDLVVANTSVIKTNLSTTANPTMQANIVAPVTLATYTANIDDPENFLRLIWECVTVNSGGYYLNYTETGTKNGLPDAIFDTSNTASIQLMVIFGSQRHSHAVSANQPPMLKFCNSVVLSDHIDLGNAELVVEAAHYKIQEGMDLSNVQTNMGFATLADFVAVNQFIKILLRDGLIITSGSGTIVRAGDNLQMIADRVGATPIIIANEVSGNTDALIVGALCQYAQGQMKLVGTGAVGSVGVETMRPNPDPDDLPYASLSNTQKQELMFNLLGLDLAANTWFQPVVMETDTGLNAGNASEWPASGPVVPQNASSTTKQNIWTYQKIIPYYEFAKSETNSALAAPHLPLADQNPYAGIMQSSVISFDMHFQDNFGNRTDGGTPSGSLSVPVGYRDSIHPLSAWPSVAISYIVSKISPQPSANVTKIGVEIDSGFQIVNYVSGDGQTFAQARKRLAADHEKFRQIYYQIIQPDMQMAMTTTLDRPDGVSALSYLPKSNFIDIVNAALLFFNQQLEVLQVKTAGTNGDTLADLNSKWLITDPGSILKANMLMPVGSFFDLTAPHNQLTVPVNILSRAGQSLTNLAASSTAAMGASVTEIQVVDQNANKPVNVATDVIVPIRTFPTGNDPAIGDQSLAQLSQYYHTSNAGIVEANRAKTDIIRPGIDLSLQGIEYTTVDGDSFDALAAAFMNIEVTAILNTLQKLADARGISVGALAFANESNTTIIATGATFTYPDPTSGTISVVAEAHDSLYVIANKIADQLPDAVITVESLVTYNKDVAGLLILASQLNTGLVSIRVEDVASANANVASLFIASAQLQTAMYNQQKGDTIASIIADFIVIDPGFTTAIFATTNIKTANLFASGTQLQAGIKQITPDLSEQLVDLAETHSVTYAQIGKFNSTQPLDITTNKKFLIPERTTAEGLTFGAIQPTSGSTIAQVASLFGSITAGHLVQTNYQMWRTLTPGKSIQLNGMTVITIANDCFETIWTKSGGGPTPDYDAIANAVDLASALRNGAVLVGPKANAGASNIKPSDLANSWNVAVQDLLTANQAVSDFLNPDTNIVFSTASGAVTVTVRQDDTINTFYNLCQSTAALDGLDKKSYLATLAITPALIKAGAVFVMPPTMERMQTQINQNFASKLFRVTLSAQLARVNFKVTTQTISSLKSIPDIDDAQADMLNAMASAGTLYIDGDQFDAELRTAFGSQTDLGYLISMTRRYSVLPTVLIDPSFKDVISAQSTQTSIPAHTTPDTPQDPALSLQAFALAFQAAFDDEVKVCVSAGGDAAQPEQTSRKLWAVDFSAAGYGFTVNSSEPSYYARKPISNRLLDQSNVPMRHYISGEPVAVIGAEIDIKQANLDNWAKQFFETIDLALSPECAVTIHQHEPDALKSLVAIKGQLATKIAATLSQLIDNGHAGNLDVAQMAFEDRLCIKLADAYNVEAVLQFPVNVTNGGPERAGTKPPRLFGQPVNLPYITAPIETISSLADALKVSQPYLLEIIGQMPGFLNTGKDGKTPITVTYVPTGTSAEPTNTDSLTTLAKRLGITGIDPVQELIDNLTILPSGKGLFTPDVPLNTTCVTYINPIATDIESVALNLDISVLQLANAMQDRTGLFNPSVTTLTWLYGNNQTASVPVSAVSTFNTLAAALATAGVTPTPDAAAVANYYRTHPDNLVAQNAVLNIIEVLPNYAFSATAVPLSQSASDLTFFLEIANQARARKVFMDLDFPINQIEHDIQDVVADAGYENSSWLSFLLPFDSSGGTTNTHIGQTEIPVPNENYPDNPIIAGQGGIPTPLPAQNVSVMDLKDWNYFYEIEYRAAAQDLIYTGITINDVSHMSTQNLAVFAVGANSEPDNILQALAQFNVNYQPLVDDLQQLPFLSAEDEGNPALACAPVLAEFAAMIEQYWSVLPPEPAIPAGVDGDHGYVLTMTREREQEDFLDTLIITAQDAGETLWPGKVQVKENDDWYDLTKLTVNPSTEVVFQYPHQMIHTNSKLTHRIFFEGLDVITYQSAAAGMHITRNENLSSQGPTDTAFIYKTPEFATANPYTPLIERSDPFVLQSPPAPNNSLPYALSNFFKLLFDIGSISWSTGSTRLIKLHIAYRFDLAPGQPLAGSNLTPQAPSVLHTQYEFNLNPASGSPDYDVATGTFVSNVTEAITNWTIANLDPGQTGYLVFDLVTFELKENTAPSPILKLHTLLWELT